MSSTPAMLSRAVGTAFFAKFDDLRPVQAASIGPILAGDDVLIRAGTGSGKTEAATAPLIDRWCQSHLQEPSTRIVYVSPTRALVNDLARRLEPPLEQLDISVGVRHSERDDLARRDRPTVLVTTPESFDIIVGNRSADLDRVTAVVLDEVHLLHNTQRGLQLAIALRRLEEHLGRSLQIVALSATVAYPKSVWSFFRPGREFIDVHDETARGIELSIRLQMSYEQLAARVSRLTGDVKILVFVNSRRECDALADALQRSSAFPEGVFAHHSSLEQAERLHVEEAFGSRRRCICVATSTLELGIDIGDIDLIVLYGVPADWQSFMQRIGRGNRRKGTVEALCASAPPKTNESPRIRDELGFQALRHQLAAGVGGDDPGTYELFGAAAQQIVSAIAARSGEFIGINSLAQMTDQLPHLNRDVIEEILEELVSRDVLTKHPVQRRYGAGPGLHELARIRQLWSNLPMSSRTIQIRHGAAVLGTVSAQNLVSLQVDAVFTFAARRWRVEDLKGDAIQVAPTGRAPTATLKFSGLAPVMGAALADRIRVLISSGDVGDCVSPHAAGIALREKYTQLAPYVADDFLSWFPEAGDFVYVTFAGRTANQVIASWSGLSITDARDLTIRSNAPIDFARLPDEPSDLLPWIGAAEIPLAGQTTFQQLLPAELRRRELVNAWTQDHVHRRVLTRLRAANMRELPGPLRQLVAD